MCHGSNTCPWISELDSPGVYIYGARSVSSVWNLTSAAGKSTVKREDLWPYNRSKMSFLDNMPSLNADNFALLLSGGVAAGASRQQVGLFPHFRCLLIAHFSWFTAFTVVVVLSLFDLRAFGVGWWYSDCLQKVRSHAFTYVLGTIACS